MRRYKGVLSVSYEMELEAEAPSRLKAMEELEDMAKAFHSPPAHATVISGPTIEIVTFNEVEESAC